MMKFVVAAVVLLHLCHAGNWRMEVLDRLRNVTNDGFTFVSIVHRYDHSDTLRGEPRCGYMWSFEAVLLLSSNVNVIMYHSVPTAVTDACTIKENASQCGKCSHFTVCARRVHFHLTLTVWLICLFPLQVACKSTFTSALRHVLSNVKAKTSERQNVLDELKGLLLEGPEQVRHQNVRHRSFWADNCISRCLTV